MTTSILANLYLGKTKSTESQVLLLPNDDPLAQLVRKFPLSPLPILNYDSFPTEVRGLRILASLLAASTNYSYYDRKSYEDIERTRRLITRVAEENSIHWPLELKAFVIHNLLAYVVAYRSRAYFDGSTEPFLLPVWRRGELFIEPCKHLDDINILGGVCVRVFVPVSGSGTPTFLFHGTLLWNCANGAGITIADDFNPLGIGAAIRYAMRRRLKDFTVGTHQKYGEGAIAIGQSLGGLLAVVCGADFVKNIDRVYAFAPPKYAYQLRKSAHPHCYTFYARCGNYVDPVIGAGEAWVGRVFEVAHVGDLDPIGRHVRSLSNTLDCTIREVEETGWTTSWQNICWCLLQRVVMTVIFACIFPVLLVKRALFGWSTSTRWRYGLLSPFKKICG